MSKIDPCSPDRCRTIRVHGYEYGVPKHVVRLDAPNLAGWQVRWDGTRYFSDSAFGGAEGSFHAATAHLRKVWRPVKKKTARGRAGRPGAEAGISLITDSRDGVPVVYVQATGPKAGIVRRIYVGTENTATVERVRKATRVARAWRAEQLRKYPIPVR
jgi:hypothetical protein